MTKEPLPCIIEKCEKDVAGGSIIKEKFLKVQGTKLSDVKKVFDDEWKK